MSLNKNNRMEGTYLVDDKFLLHLTEEQYGFRYDCFEVPSGNQNFKGMVPWGDIESSVSKGIMPSVRNLAIEDIGLKGDKMAVVSADMMERLPGARKVFYQHKKDNPEEEKSIRFINSKYDDLFKIPDGGVIDIAFPNRNFKQKCSYIDEYHFRIGYEVFHICQFAEMLEKNHGVCQPEPELDAEEAAWKIGTKGYLLIQTSEDGYDFTVLDAEYKEIDGGQLDMPEASILEARNNILNDYGWGMQSMYEVDYEDVMERFDAGELEKKGSVLQLLTDCRSGEPSERKASVKQKEEVL